MGVRIFTLAKELDMTSKELISFLKTQGHKVSSHMSSIDDPVAKILRDRLKPKAAEAPAEKPKASPAAAKKGESRPAGSATQKTPAAATGKKKKVRRFFPTNEYTSGGPGRFAGKSRRSSRKGGGGDPAERKKPVVFKAPEKIEVSVPLALKDLSSALGMKAQVLIKTLFKLGKPVTINDFLDEDLILEVCMEIGTEVEFKKKEEDEEELLKTIEEEAGSDEDKIPKAPVVTFLGHVDHGKTSLLDKIRETQVTAREHGGITQHLGAYRVDNGDVKVTFIDTPGHKAFTEMRARGANVTDVAVLVVAADDGPMPQTEEAINHVRAAEVPIIVAINKIDLASANSQRCKEQLSGLGLNPVDWGGETEMVEVSAQTGEGLDNLLETLSLESEILELKANPQRSALGIVLEAEATTNRGVLTTVLIKDGTLKHGDCVLAGACYGRVRDLIVNGSEQVEEAGPSVPVTIVGLNAVPDAGAKLYVLENEKQARQIAETRARNRREMEQAEKSSGKKRSLIDLVEKVGSGDVVDLNLIIKADVRGSIEALRSSLVGLSTDEVQVEIIHTAVGAVSQEDVQLASASDAVIIGFHVVADDRARAVAEEAGVEIRSYKVIYEVVDDIRAAMEARLAPEELEEFHGRATIRQVFKASKIGNIAGCIVSTGKILRNDKIRLIRNDVPIHEGSIANLKRLKDDAREVKEGFECGIKLKGYEDIKEDDVIEAYTITQKARTLDG
ncbi:MAG: translation initiation factor IF-2 [Planctomycetota bacterium]|nr:translation initiation factor IF-2 [Planctomycetota bacterium]